MESTTRNRAGVSAAVMRRVVDLARLAPSVHNTQPWSWRLDGSILELWADRTRSLPVADPEGRNLLISCGCALDHAVQGSRALGFDPTVTRFPDRQRADLLARIELRRSTVPDGADRDLAALADRHTDRRRFTSWPVPDERLAKLAAHPATPSIAAIPVTDVSLRFRLELLLEDVRLRQSLDPRYAAEAAAWIDHGPVDGIPGDALPTLTGRAGERSHRFPGGDAAIPRRRLLESSDGLILLASEADGPLHRLLAGEVLSALWLEATRQGFSVVPLSQLADDPVARMELRRELHDAHPHLLVRVGWQEISRRDLPRTSRRSLEDVLHR